MEKRNILTCSLMILGLIALVLLPADPASEAFENRAMQQRPVAGERFFYELEHYLLDNVFARTHFLQFQSVVNTGFGFATAGPSMIYFGADDLGYGLIPMVDGVGLDALTRTGRVPFGRDERFHDHAVFFLRYIEDRELSTRYAQVLNAFAEQAPESVRMFSLIAPVKVAFMGERYAAANSPQIETIAWVNSLLNERITPVDAYHALRGADDDAYLFFRTDHHWTAHGAWYAYQAFAQVAGFAPLSLEAYVEHVIDGFIGSLAVGTQNATVLAHPDSIYMYELTDGTTFSIPLHQAPEDLAQADYRVFLGGDHPRIEITSSNTNGQTLVVVKDSFANPLIVWLAPHYEQVIVIDPRQYTGSVLAILNEHPTADLLFVNYIPATTMSVLIEQIYDVR